MARREELVCAAPYCCEQVGWIYYDNQQPPVDPPEAVVWNEGHVTDEGEAYCEEHWELFTKKEEEEEEEDEDQEKSEQ